MKQQDDELDYLRKRLLNIGRAWARWNRYQVPQCKTGKRVKELAFMLRNLVEQFDKREATMDDIRWGMAVIHAHLREAEVWSPKKAAARGMLETMVEDIGVQRDELEKVNRSLSRNLMETLENEKTNSVDTDNGGDP